MRLRTIIACTLLAALLLAAAAPAVQAAAPGPRWQLIHAVNATRAAYGLPKVALARGLGEVAQRHSMDMVNRRYFAHTSPGGSTLYRRVVNSRFRTYGAWRAGETLAWGTGTRSGPWAAVRMWLGSPTHRAILLSRSYQWIGVGRAVGGFQGRANAVVWTADWGQR